MLRPSLAAVLAVLTAAAAVGQAVTEWTTVRGVAVSVIEVAGGDIVHAAAVVPPETAVPASVAGFPVEVRPTSLGLVLEVSVPAFAAVPALGTLAAALRERGAAAVVVLGGAPARELTLLAAALDDLPLAAAPRRACLLAEGDVSLLRGSPERVEVILPMPGPEDPRFDLLPALEAWLRRSLAQRWPAVSTSLDLRDSCARLLIRVPASAEHPRALLAPLRDAVRELASTTPTTADVDALANILDRRRAGWAVDGRAAARELALRRAVGGRAASALSPPLLHAEALGALARSVLSGHPGEAVLVEAERRAVEDAPEALDNGVLLAWRWVPSSVGTVGVALGGVDPETGQAALRHLAAEAAREGWHALLDILAGVPAIALAVPADDLPAALEAVASVLLEAVTPADSGWGGQLRSAVGLTMDISGGVVAVAVSAPAEADVVREAAAKFFSGLPPATVRSTVPLSPGLVQVVAEGEVTILAAVELPAGLPGWLAGEVLARRLQRLGAARTRWLAPPGRLVLEVAASGDGHVPGLDARLATLWSTARGAATADEVAAAAAALRTLLYGDPARAALRAAAAPFLPGIPRQEELRGADARDVSAALATLPAWAQIPRLGRGPEPLMVVPPPGPTVRQSPARRPGGAGGGS